MYKKRGQFTIFVVLGFVLVAAFAFLLYARSVIVEEQLKVQAHQTVRQTVQNNNLNFYVQSCIDRLADEGVRKLALQGGKLYESQGGLYPDPTTRGVDYLPFEYEEETYNVSYAIKPNLNQDCVYLNPPDYPLPDTRHQKLINAYHQNIISNPLCDFDSGAIGDFSMPKICDPYGRNRINVTGDRFDQGHTCGAPIYYANDSIQEQLENYINNNLDKCANFSFFQDRLGYNITVINNPNTSIIFGKDRFSIETMYPFNVRIKGRTVTTFANFQVNKDIDLLRAYHTIYQLVELEFKDIRYNLLDNNNNQYDVLSENNICPNCEYGRFDNLYQVVFNQETVRGQPLVFNFAVKNRAPVLDYINEGEVYDKVIIEGGTIRFAPIGIDPDEGLVTYSYGGWQENFTSVFNEQGCLQQPDTCSDNPELYVDDDYTVEPHNWSLSYEFQQTGVNATYNTNRTDLGVHHVIVQVKDNSGKIDYQNVSVAVIDIPVVTPEPEPPFPDEFGNNGSIEDPYVLNALVRSLIGPAAEKIKWSDNLEPFITIEGDFLLRLPETPNIRTIKSKNFTVEGTHTINVSARYKDPRTSQNYWTEPKTLTIEVKKCLPYKNENTAPHPYNNLAEADFPGYNYNNKPNPFNADHTCCTSDFEYVTQGSNTICFDYVEYSDSVAAQERAEIFETTELLYNPTIFNTEGIELINDNTHINDIFKRTFNRTCGGSRGNICNGTVTEVYEIHDDCKHYNDYGNNGKYQTYDNNDALFNELCQGPPTGNMTSISSFNCENYEHGTTFNTLYSHYGVTDKQGENPDGYCSDEPRCADGEGGEFTDDSGFKCLGQCDGNGDCNYATDCTCENKCGASSNCDDKLPGDVTITDNGKNKAGCSNTCGEIICDFYVFDPDSRDCKTTANSQADCLPGFYFDPDGNKCVSCNGNNIEDDGDYDGKCEADAGLTCNADSACDEQSPGSLGPNWKGCTNKCKYENCGLYAFNSQSKSCYAKSTATNINHCAYKQNVKFDQSTGTCIECDPSTQLEITIGPFANTCEINCDSNIDPNCDDKTPGVGNCNSQCKEKTGIP